VQEEWSADRAAAAIRAIATDAVDSFHPDHLWPTHPLDGDGPGSSIFYWGAGGVLWALAHLAREGVIEDMLTSLPFSIPSLIERNGHELRAGSMTACPASYLMGDLPFMMLQWRLDPSREGLSTIARKIEANNDQPALELMWGLPGSMIAAIRMHDLEPDDRWIALYRHQAARVVQEWAPTADHGYHWSPMLNGAQHTGMGAVHGFAGNVRALLSGLEHLPRDTQGLVRERTAESLLATASHNERHTNWPIKRPDVGQPHAPWRLYHCHGAPGIISSLSLFPNNGSPELESALMRAGELIWTAGALRKGPSLCHGTAGNGFALLTLFERTGDTLWLDRARSFAMRSIRQCEQARELFAQGRYSLWTGDLGVAAFLHECIRATARFPMIDVF
jgi:hypothetical protein